MSKQSNPSVFVQWPLIDATQTHRFIGIMSGTSADAVDVCCVDLTLTDNQLRPKIVATASIGIPSLLRQRLMHILSHTEQSHHADLLAELCSLNVEFGQLFVQAVQTVLTTHDIPATSVTAIGSHGQTLYHIPPGHDTHKASTWQTGEADIITEKTGITTVSDFRPADMAASGQGAPLVCLTDHLLFHDTHRTRCIQNIGGIGNVTVLPATCESRPPIAFDTGPGNMLIDEAMQQLFDQPYDANGDIAASGTINTPFLNHLLTDPYFQMAPPKTTGREHFGSHYLKTALQSFPHLAKADIIATLTALTATSIVNSYEQFILPHYPIHDLVVGGGGAYNITLMRFIREQLDQKTPETQLKTHDDFNIPNQYKEALAFAILAWATLTGQPGNIPSCTGAQHAAILGKVSFPPSLRF